MFPTQAYQMNFMKADKAVLNAEYFQFDVSFCDNVTARGFDVIIKVNMIGWCGSVPDMIGWFGVFSSIDQSFRQYEMKIEGRYLEDDWKQSL